MSTATDDFPECADLPAGQRKICRGETKHPAVIRNAYRERWGIAPRQWAPRQMVLQRNNSTGEVKLVGPDATASTTESQEQKSPAAGVGTEFMLLLQSLGVKPTPNCPCTKVRKKMDRLGIAGCIENRDELIAKLKKNAQGFGIAVKLKAGWFATLSGLAFSLNPLDPIPGLFDEAVRRAQAKESPT